MKLLIDVNLSPKWVKALIDQNYEAVRWSELGKVTDTDETIMTYAAEHGHVILTHDQDFSTLLAHSKDGKPSVVLLRTSSLKVEKVIERIVKTLDLTKEDLELGAIVVIEDKRVRIRELPMK